MKKEFDYFVKLVVVPPDTVPSNDMVYVAGFTHERLPADVSMEEVCIRALTNYLIDRTINEPTNEELNNLKELCSVYTSGLQLPSDHYGILMRMGEYIQNLTLDDDLAGLDDIVAAFIEYSTPIVPVPDVNGNYLPTYGDYHPFTLSPDYHMLKVGGTESLEGLLIVIKRVEVEEQEDTDCRKGLTTQEQAQAFEQSTHPAVDRLKDLFQSLHPYSHIDY